MTPDAHCHLDQLEDPEAALREAEAAGTAPILAVSMDAASAEATLGLRDRHPGLVLAGVGLHPSRVAEMTAAEQERELGRLESLAASADFIGEIGLDFRDAGTAGMQERQREALARQLEWAAARRLPINMHSRRADREVLESAIAYRRRSGCGALLHWFTHSRKLARLAAEAGLFISPGPSVLIDPPTCEVARAIADPALLVETDAPVVYGREGAASPGWAPRVLARLAELREVSRADLEKVVADNLDRYLGRS
jgi:TatD DNase family protein